ncbi:MAG: hypothetical protein JSU59_10745 [Nitrospirota bacterium]|nr:MAG: hypothetical protein JSU59_10745 [Nitrospirota bacterium]
MQNLIQSGLTIFQFFLALIFGWPGNSEGIVVHPSEIQIQEALQAGDAAAKGKIPSNKLYWQFGPDAELKSHGFLMTKMNGLTVMSTHFALRSEKPSKQDIEQILKASELQIVVTVFGSSPQFAVDSYMVMKQSNRLIKPRWVRSDARASRSSAWPESPAYQEKIVAAFPYDTFDPKAATAVVIFPGEGGEINFEMNFSAIP